MGAVTVPFWIDRDDREVDLHPGDLHFARTQVRLWSAHIPVGKPRKFRGNVFEVYTGYRPSLQEEYHADHPSWVWLFDGDREKQEWKG